MTSPAYIRPRRLSSGDVIGIVSPAGPVAALCPERLQRGRAHLEDLGFWTRLGVHATALHGHTAGTPKQRADDIHSMFLDPKVCAIMSTIGGMNSNQVLEWLDYDLIRENPKIFIGYSDITALLIGIYKRTGLSTFLGPAVLPQFGEAELHPYNRKWFEHVLCKARPAGELEPSLLCIHETLRWGVDDDRPRRADTHAGPRVLVSGSASGPILAGNMGVILALAGTEWFPDFDGVILCIEDDEVETPATIDRYLTQLRQIGVFDRIAGLVIGRFHPGVGFHAKDPLDEIVLEATRGCDIPIALDLDFGHSDPMFVLPQGVQAKLELGGNVRFELSEPAVR